jgi:large subunit ribosomal protein L15
MQRNFETINLHKIQEFIDMGRLVPKPDSFITMRNLVDCGMITQAQDGIKILAKNKEELRTPIHLEVSCASTAAIQAVEAAGGTVTAVHFNTLALRALLKPTNFDILPRRARPPPKIMPFYLDEAKAGYLSPSIQLRNLELFGQVTSEETCRKEHEQLMELRRRLTRAQRTAGFRR